MAALERAVALDKAALAGAGTTKAAFKKAAGEAVRARDVHAMRRRAKSTVSHHLLVLGDPDKHTNTLQQYLTGALSVSERFKLIFRAGVLPTARRSWQHRAVPAVPRWP